MIYKLAPHITNFSIVPSILENFMKQCIHFGKSKFQFLDFNKQSQTFNVNAILPASPKKERKQAKKKLLD